MGMVSAFPFNSFFSLLVAQSRTGFINNYGCFNKKKISKANLPGAVLLRCDCETTEMLFNSLHDPKTRSMYSLELKQLICSDKGHSHSLNQFHHIIILLFTKQSKCSARESIVGLLTAVGMFTSPYAWPHIWCLTHTHLLWNTKLKRNFGVVFG